MKTSYTELILTSLFMVPLVGHAQTEVPHIFEAGRPARAAEVNENFVVIEGSVNATASAIAENEAAIADNAEAIAAIISSQGQASVLDFTLPDQCVIDMPGYYVLNKNWDFSPADPEGACTSGISIDADGVSLDLQGYRITCDLCGGPALSSQSHNNVVVRNGSLKGSVAGSNVDDIAFWFEDGRIERLSVEGVVLVVPWSFGDQAVISNLSVTGDLEINPGGDPGNRANGKVSIVSSEIDGWIYARETEGVEVLDSQFGRGFFESTPASIVRNTIAGGLQLEYSAEIVAWNTIGHRSGSPISHGIFVTDPFAPGGAIIEGNIIRNAEVGIEFRDSTGNFFGNNRVSANSPFVGAGGQTDWGGNASF